MIKLNYIFIFLFITVCINNTKAQEIPVSDFIESASPKLDSKEWYELNNRQKPFEVENDNGKLKISLKKLPEQNDELQVKNGLLKGIDRGEWGGLMLFINDKTHKTDTITRGNIRMIFEYENDIYFITSLAHMSFNEGALYKLKLVKGKYIDKKIMDFDDAPQSFCILNHDLLIASFSGFYRIYNFQKQIIFKNEFWWGLSPVSLMAIDDRAVYIGILGGYLKLDLVRKCYVFYKYKYL